MEERIQRVMRQAEEDRKREEAKVRDFIKEQEGKVKKEIEKAVEEE